MLVKIFNFGLVNSQRKDTIQPTNVGKTRKIYYGRKNEILNLNHKDKGCILYMLLFVAAVQAST